MDSIKIIDIIIFLFVRWCRIVGFFYLFLGKYRFFILLVLESF